MKKMKSVFTVLCAAFSGLFLASVFAGAGGVAKSSDKLAEDVAATPDALTTSSSSTLPKFVDHRDYLAADGPHSMVTADLNGDGVLDLVLDDGNTSGVSVLLGNRDGTFQLFALFDCGCAFPVDVAVADFNGDGKNDVAETSSSGVSILLGDGAGNLGTPQVLKAGVAPQRIVAADLNGDRKIDLAVTNLGSNTVSIFLGNGDGTFGAAKNITVGMGPDGIAAGDFNGDGHLAVATSPTRVALTPKSRAMSGRSGWL